MRKTTKFLTLVLAVLMMVSTFAMSTSAAFTDVDVDNLALADAVELLSTLGVAKGTSDTTFSPDAEVNRQQMAAFIYRLMKAGKSVEGGANNSGFVDLADATFYYMITWAAQQNIIKGTSATTFNPTGNITLQDAYVMLVRALGYEKDEALPYPFGYIDVAEEIGLDEDLPSDVSYTTPLTRGNVAIVLANAFYAEMNEKTTEWAKIPGSTDQWYEKEVPATVSGKIFGVEKETFKVLGTANYNLGTAENSVGANDDKDQLLGYRVDKNDKFILPEFEADETTPKKNDKINGVAATAETFTLEDLGLEGSSDDYFLADITLFVKKDGKDATKDEIIAAQSALVKKTVTASDVVIARSEKTDKEYYVLENKKNDKVMTGLVDFGGTKTYFGNTAPKSVKDDADEANSVKFIELTAGGWSEDGAKFGYKEVAKTVADYKTSDHDVLTDSFMKVLPEIYYGGLYAADVYDVDGNGYADYICIKNYDKIIEIKESTKKAQKHDGGEIANGAEVYDKEITIVGEYAYGDKLLVYAPGTVDYIEVAATLEATEAKITNKVTTDGGKITLSNGDVISFKNMREKSTLAKYDISEYKVGETFNYYVYNGVILGKGEGSATEFDADANYAIILKDAFDGDVDTTVYKAITGVKDGELQEALYVKAIIGGAAKTVKLADNIYTHYVFKKDGTLDTDNLKDKVASLKVTDATKMEAVLEAEFADKIVTYTATDAGVYTFKALELDDISKVDFKSKEIAGAGTYYANGYVHELANFNKSTYTIGDGKKTDADDAKLPFTRFTVTEDSIIVIETKNEKTGEPEYAEYTVENLPKFDATEFEDIKAIFANNIESGIEYVGYLYAKIGEFKSGTTKEYRIITASETKYDEELEKGVSIVTILDPATCTTVSGVELAEEFVPDIGMLVVLKEDGTVERADYKDSYKDGVLFKATWDDFEEAAGELQVKGDDIFYMVDEDTKVTIFVKGDAAYEADIDALLDQGLDNAYEELQVKDATNTLWILAEDLEGDDATKPIKTVKYVIIATDADAIK